MVLTVSYQTVQNILPWPCVYIIQVWGEMCARKRKQEWQGPERFEQKRFTYRLLTRHDFLPVWQVTRLEAERYVPDRLWYCPPSAAKPVIESKYKLRSGLADLHFWWGAEVCGGYHIFMSDWRALMTPQKATLDSLRTLSWFVSYRRLSSQFQFSLSAITLEYLSRWIWGFSPEKGLARAYYVQCRHARAKDKDYEIKRSGPGRFASFRLRLPDDIGVVTCKLAYHCHGTGSTPTANTAVLAGSLSSLETQKVTEVSQRLRK